MTDRRRGRILSDQERARRRTALQRRRQAMEQANRGRNLPGPIYKNEEATRLSETMQRWQEAGFDRRIMVEAGYWTEENGPDPE